MPAKLLCKRLSQRPLIERLPCFLCKDDRLKEERCDQMRTRWTVVAKGGMQFRPWRELIDAGLLLNALTTCIA